MHKKARQNKTKPSLFDGKSPLEQRPKSLTGETVDKKVNAIVEHVENLAELNRREQVVLGDGVVLSLNAHFIEKNTPRNKIRQVEHGVRERHEQKHSGNLVRVVWRQAASIVGQLGGRVETRRSAFMRSNHFKTSSVINQTLLLFGIDRRRAGVVVVVVAANICELFTYFCHVCFGDLGVGHSGALVTRFDYVQHD
jgi:hypothetical protein